MADVLMTAVASGAAAGGAAATAGMPPQHVVVWAVVGGLVNAWLAAATAEPVTLRWIARQLARVGVAASAGIALSAVVLAIAPAYSLTAPISTVPEWALAGVISGGLHLIGPRLMSAVFGKLGV